MSAAKTFARAAARPIVHRTKGHRHGPITRLVSPGDLGERIKPFVFLDLFEVDTFQGKGFAPHPRAALAEGEANIAALEQTPAVAELRRA